MSTMDARLSPGRLFLTVLFCASLICGCKQDKSPANGGSSGTENETQISEDQKPFDYAEYQRKKDAALAAAAKDYEENMRRGGLPTNFFPLPNWPTGPGQPKPLGINFYTADTNYPGYLLCCYDVDEQHYDPSNEPAWFNASILQIRGTGQQRFPPNIKWIAIAIANWAEHKGASTYEKCYKVGALFKASDVFDPQINPSVIIADAQKDRHPFHYDPKTEEQHWAIVERDAAEKAKSK